MNLDSKNEQPLKDSIHAVLDFAPKGNSPGTHNFLRIKTNENIHDLVSCLKGNNYTVLVFDDLREGDKKLIEKLHIYAQSYTANPMASTEKGLPLGKVAIIFTDKAWEEVLRSPATHDICRSNNRYIVSLG